MYIDYYKAVGDFVRNKFRVIFYFYLQCSQLKHNMTSELYDPAILSQFDDTDSLNYYSLLMSPIHLLVFLL